MIYSIIALLHYCIIALLHYCIIALFRIIALLFQKPRPQNHDASHCPGCCGWQLNKCNDDCHDDKPRDEILHSIHEFSLEVIRIVVHRFNEKQIQQMNPFIHDGEKRNPAKPECDY